MTPRTGDPSTFPHATTSRCSGRSAARTTRGRLGAATLACASVALSGLVASGTATVAEAAAPQKLSFVASADAYTSSAAPARTFDTERLVAGTIGSDRKVTYLKFPVAGIPAGATDVTATLTLARDLHKLPPNVTVSAVAGSSWDETTLTANTAPPVGAQLASTSPVATSAGVSVPLKTVRTNGTYSFAVTSTTTGDVARFRSAESGFAAPTLTVSFVPAAGLNLVAGAAVNGLAADGTQVHTIELFNQSNSRVGPHRIRRSFNSSLPASFAASDARNDAANGYTSFVSWKPPGGDFVGAAAGRYDAAIAAWARTVPAGTYATSYHEPENDMTGAQFVALQRHLYTTVKTANPGIKWGPIYMAYWWHVGSNHYVGDRNAWWPGSAYADFTAVDAYSTRPKPLETDPAFRGWYDFMLDKGEPMLITEYGRYVVAPGQPRDPALEAARARVIEQDAAWIRSQGRISMWLLWDGVGAKGDWRLNDEASRAAWRAVAATAALR